MSLPQEDNEELKSLRAVAKPPSFSGPFTLVADFLKQDDMKGDETSKNIDFLFTKRHGLLEYWHLFWSYVLLLCVNRIGK